MNELNLIINVNNKIETKNIAKIIAKHSFKGEIITLNGDLGAGKTFLVKKIGQYIGIKEEINSPTFNILKCYFNLNLNLYHIDAYRLNDSSSFSKDIGLEEVIYGDGITLIEWPNYIKEYIDFNYSLNININFLNNDEKREFIFSTFNEKFNDLYIDLKREFN